MPSLPDREKKQWPPWREAIMTAAMLLGLAACATGLGPSLRLNLTEPRTVKDVHYRLIMYGGVDAHEYETVAILDREDDPYLIVSHAGDTKVQTRTGLSRDAALSEARTFLSRHIDFRDIEIRELRMADGHIPGYEIRTAYNPIVGQKAYELDTSYFFRPDGTIGFIATVPLKVDGREPPLLGNDRHH